MKLDKRFKLERALCSPRKLRPHLEAAWLDVEEGKLAATDGHVLAVVPVETNPSDRSGPVPRAAIVAARRENVVMRLGLAVVEALLFRRDRRHGCPVSTEKQRRQVWPTFKRGDKGTVTIAFSAELLASLAAAIGANKGRVVLTVQPSEDLGPILVEPLSLHKSDKTSAAGVLMPCRP